MREGLGGALVGSPFSSFVWGDMALGTARHSLDQTSPASLPRVPICVPSGPADRASCRAVGPGARVFSQFKTGHMRKRRASRCHDGTQTLNLGTQVRILDRQPNCTQTQGATRRNRWLLPFGHGFDHNATGAGWLFCSFDARPWCPGRCRNNRPNLQAPHHAHSLALDTTQLATSRDRRLGRRGDSLP